MQLRASVTLDEQRDEVSDSAVDVPGMDLGDDEVMSKAWRH